MDYDYTPEQQQFRTQVRGYLEAAAAELFGDFVGSSGATVESLLYSDDDQFWQKVPE